jgi:hypothetical protein
MPRKIPWLSPKHGSATERSDALAHAEQPHPGFDREIGRGLAVVIDGGSRIDQIKCPAAKLLSPA